MSVRSWAVGWSLAAALATACCHTPGEDAAGTVDVRDGPRSEGGPAVPEASGPRLAALPRPESDYGPFPQRLALDGEPLVLNGSGLCEWGLFGFDLYRAALYTREPFRDLAAVLQGSPRSVFHLHFVRALTHDQLAAAYTAAVRANAGAAFARHEPALAALCALLPDVAVGSGLTFVADQDRGVELFHDGVALGRAGDPEFARLFVALYLGDHPPTAALRQGLLGGD